MRWCLGHLIVVNQFVEIRWPDLATLPPIEVSAKFEKGPIELSVMGHASPFPDKSLESF